jgi:hypothetical protein
MVVMTHINDDDLLEYCRELNYVCEIGELHERDKFTWSVQ